MKFGVVVLASILTGCAGAEVADPCLICRDGATVGDDFRPFAAEGSNATCADMLEEIKGIEAGSIACVDAVYDGFEGIRSVCCPETLPVNPCIVCAGGITLGDDIALTEFFGDTTTCREYVDSAAVYEAESHHCIVRKQGKYEPFCCPATPENPCIICPDGATAGDDFAPNAEFYEIPLTCKKYIDMFKTFEEESDMCELSQYYAGGGCCPSNLSAPENPCVACPNGISVGDDFAPYAGSGNLVPCSKMMEEFLLVDSENFICGAEKEWQEALCCPTTPKNPCNVCPDGLTAADDFFPPDDWQTCKQNIDTLLLMETESMACSDWGPFYKATCCPKASTASTSTNATVVPPTEPSPSGGATKVGLRGVAFIIGVIVLSLIDFA
jgi:hypothetical protein